MVKIMVNCNENESNSIEEEVTNQEKDNILNEEPIPKYLHFNIRFNSTQASELFELMKQYQYGKRSDTIRKAISL